MSTVPLRCRYSDCIEGHPVAKDDYSDFDDDDAEPSTPVPEAEREAVTCPTCREYMGLPALIPGTLDYAENKP